MESRPSHEVLFCLRHLMCASMELLIDSLSLMSSSFVQNCFSTFSSVQGSPMESHIVAGCYILFFSTLIKFSLIYAGCAI